MPPEATVCHLFLNYFCFFSVRKNGAMHIHTYIHIKPIQGTEHCPVIYAESIWMLEDEEDEGYVTE